MDKISVIGLMGLPGTGKSSLASMLSIKAGYKQFAFADILKDQCAQVFGCSRLLFEDRGLKNYPLYALRYADCSDSGFVAFMRGKAEKEHGQAPSGFLLHARTPRHTMQQYSDYYKTVNGENYYRDWLFTAIYCSGSPLAVISDVRYEAEVQGIFTRFKDSTIVHLTRELNPYAEEGRAKHESDADLKNFADLKVSMPGESEAELSAVLSRVLIHHAEKGNVQKLERRAKLIFENTTISC